MNDFDDLASRAGAGLSGMPVETPDPSGLRRRRTRRTALRVGAGALASAAVVAVAAVALTDDGKQTVQVITPSSTTVPATETTVPPPESSTTTTLVPDIVEAPELISMRNGVLYAGKTSIAEVPGGVVAYRLSNGAFAVGVRRGDVRSDWSVVLLDADGSQTGTIEHVDLVGAGVVDGRDQLLLVEYLFGREDGPLVRYDVASGQRFDAGDGWSAGDSSIHRASIAGNVIVESWTADLSVAARFVDLDGNPVTGWPDLTGNLPYPSLDVYSLLVSPDGRRLAYLDGPPVDFQAGADRAGNWDVVVVDRNGTELQRIPLGGNGGEDWHLDFNGKFAVVSRTGSQTLVFDVDAREVEPDTPGYNGVTTFAR